MTVPWAQRWRGRDRIVPAIAALLVNAVIGYALLVGLRGPSLLRAVVDSAPLALFDLKPPAPDKPQPSPPAKPQEDKREGGTASAPAPRAQPVRPQTPRPSTIVTPPPVIAVTAPTLPAALPPSGTGGTGLGNAGGNGEGFGSGGTGNGTGRGEGDGGDFSRARQTGGSFRNSDFPDWLRGVGRLKIGVRYAIAPSGHVDKCEVIEGSGYAEVDAMTCRIIMERYRFRPARDPDGYAVTEVREEDYRWRVR